MLNEFYDIPKKNLFKVPPPLLSSKFTMYPRKTPSKPNVLFIGRLFKLKGGEVILKNLDKFINNCKLTMVTNDEKANIKGIKYFNNNLTDEQILNLYKTNDILILPCFFDTFGAVIAEASAAGLAVITSKFVIGSKDIIVNNETGIIADTQKQCIDELVKLIKDPQKIDDFKIAGYNKKQVDEKFSGMINALSYGAPPHGGIAPGIDRIVMLLANEKNIREVTMFPMNQNAQDLMMNAPSTINDEQLKELGLVLKIKK